MCLRPGYKYMHYNQGMLAEACHPSWNEKCGVRGRTLRVPELTSAKLWIAQASTTGLNVL